MASTRGMSWHAAYEKAQEMWGKLATVEAPASAYTGRAAYGKWGTYKVGVRPYTAAAVALATFLLTMSHH
jgi:hypothetical protein